MGHKAKATLTIGFLTLLLSGCAGGESTDAAASAPAPTTAEEAPSAPATTNAAGDEIGDFNTDESYDEAGSVTTEDGRFVEYPDGFRIDFVGADAPRTNTSGEDGRTDVVVSLAYSNSGTTPVDTEGMNFGVEPLLYGINGESATLYGGGDDLPARVSPGTQETRTLIFSVPIEAIGEPMEFTVSPDTSRYTEFTFLDLDKVLTK